MPAGGISIIPRGTPGELFIPGLDYSGKVGQNAAVANAAMTNLSNAGGGTAIVGAGTISIEAPLLIPQDVGLFLLPGTILIQAPGTVFTTFPAMVVLNGIRAALFGGGVLDGNRASGVTNHLALIQFDSCTVRDLILRNAGNVGLYDNHSGNRVSGLRILQSGGAGITLDNASFVTYNNIEIFNSGQRVAGDGILLMTQAIGCCLTGIVCTDNQAVKTQRDGIRLTTGTTLTAISGCDFSFNGGWGVNELHDSQGGTFTDFNAISGCTFQGNANGTANLGGNGHSQIAGCAGN